jgi:hypothetical protein
MKSLSGKMGIVLIGLVIFGYGEVLGADWRLYATVLDGDEFYYDASSIIRPSRNIVRVWTKTVVSNNSIKEYVDKLGSSFQLLSHKIILLEIDCTEKKDLLLQTTGYANDGKILMSVTVKESEKEWVFILPDTVGEPLYEAVCK